MNWFFRKDKKDKRKKGEQPEAEAAEVVTQEEGGEPTDSDAGLGMDAGRGAEAFTGGGAGGGADAEPGNAGTEGVRAAAAEAPVPEAGSGGGSAGAEAVGAPAVSDVSVVSDAAVISDAPAVSDLSVVSDAAVISDAPAEPVKKGFFARLKEGMTKTRNQLATRVEELLGMNRELNDEFYEELEELLLASDLGVKTTMAVVEELRKRIPEKRLREAAQVKAELKEILIERMAQTLEPVPKPAILMVVGVNGVGKTTSIGKMAHLYRQQGRNVLIAAADTFRAAAAEQLTMWAERAQVPIIKHEEGADPAAVVFDAIHAARARQADLLIVDTAGRLQNKKHLMEELRKMTRIAEREWQDARLLTWLVIDATTGQNGINQAREFQAVSKLDGLIVSKLDGTAKGGVAVSVRGELGVPVRFVAVGERIDDLQPFDPRAFVEAML